MKVKDVKCPYCERNMIKTFFECHDSSGWFFSWACNCEDIRVIERQKEQSVKLFNNTEYHKIKKI